MIIILNTERYSEHPYQTVEQIESLIQDFEACTLASEDWTHQAHLVVALWYLIHNTEEQAISLIRHGIKRYREHTYISQGKVPPKEGGYHETITLFYVKVLQSQLHTSKENSSIVELASKCIFLWGDKSKIFRYYSRERLFSLQARSDWVDPDLMPLNEIV